ncbi:unnamed protein product [Rotaria sp. Silwood2]|nr:unnamed protein product [Rotaria sp. Silwood2]CAF4303665.1 unnamed protein product [Rotaria sp. Silwood2]
MTSVPISYQQELIPMKVTPGHSFQLISMTSQYKDHSAGYSNSFKHNRIAPQQPDDNISSISNNCMLLKLDFSNRIYCFLKVSHTPLSIHSTKELIQPSQMYSLKQRTMDSIYSNNSHQSYSPQNSYMKDVHLDNLEQNDKSTSCCWQPLCLGLTRFTGGILFGTIILLGSTSIGGLIASAILYVNDPYTNSQWKMLGILVCSAMLIAILITLCLFMYAYKRDRTANHDNKSSLATSECNQEGDFQKTNHSNRSYDISSPSYEKIRKISAFSTNESLPNQIDQTILQQKNNVINVTPKTIIRLENHHHQHDEEQHPSRFIERKPRHDIVEKIIERPKRRSVEEHVEFTKLSKNDEKQIGNRRKGKKFKNVSIKRVKAVE